MAEESQLRQQLQEVAEGSEEYASILNDLASLSLSRVRSAMVSLKGGLLVAAAVAPNMHAIHSVTATVRVRTCPCGLFAGGCVRGAAPV